MRIALVSCVKSKQSLPAPARDLYTSPLFRGMRRYAETHADSWYILSAEHGVLPPDKVTAPYERTLNTMRRQEREVWGERVRAQLLELLPLESEVILLAGKRYREPIETFLQHRGHVVTVPMKGLGFGKQLSWLSCR